jgi:DNA (cytosine-5)-methyltransferase 3A
MSEGKKEKINVLSLFDGMSCGQIALERVGVEVDNYFASEIDKHAIKVTQANYPDTIQLGSVLTVKASDLPKIDLLIGGSPCQSFSNIGNGKGFNGKSGLFWEYVRCLKELIGKNPDLKFLLENVVMKKEWEDIISEALGVKPIMIDSALVSAQRRKRLYWTNIPNIQQPEDKEIKLEFKLEWFDKVELVPFVLKKIESMNTLNQFFNPYNSSILTEKAPTLTATGNSQTKSASIMYNNNGVFYMANSDYWEILQTIPSGHTSGFSQNIRKNLIGNGWTVDVIAHIFSSLKGEEIFNNFSNENAN